MPYAELSDRNEFDCRCDDMALSALAAASPVPMPLGGVGQEARDRAGSSPPRGQAHGLALLWDARCAVPQTLRGMPGSFGGQQQQSQQQQNRAVSSRLPNASGNSNSGWAFSGAVPMGNNTNGGFPTQTRQLGGSVSFAQSLGGSQQAAPLDLSENVPSPDRRRGLAYAAVVKGEFPSLSNNSQLGNPSQASMWSTPGSRNVSAPVQRNQSTPVSSQHAGQEELYNSTSRLTANHGSLRFANQTGPQVTPSSVDDFPPLNRTVNGEERSASLMSSLGISTPSSSSPSLLANNRANEPRSQSLAGSAVPTTQTLENDNRSRAADRLNKQLANLGNGEGSSGLSVQESLINKVKEDQAQGTVDPLAGMPDVDKWGLKGLQTLMNNYPDYHALVVGMDPNSLGLDIQSQDCPADIKQQMAAAELHTRNWRWHRKLQIWLTKDEQIAPQILGPNHERGWYIVWDANHWQRERREITLHYSDLETVVNPGAVGA
ncbi:NOT2 family protein [Cordyceps militaris CM01]|uniref:NOT2 family protein n=1 Tax=Cordyceps militaris (strain CM01) TaxID=983644 RepID=G3JJ44_CORMM|nr:NOT2 family protein [Cordyceps militaris CM01]EGX91191.1 NOT2 family protein [Cordyceps militaris CM01]